MSFEYALYTAQKKITLPFTGGRVSPMGSWRSWGTPRRHIQLSAQLTVRSYYTSVDGQIDK
eukprot:9497139-Pyramimonas_sp.AAC.1